MSTQKGVPEVHFFGSVHYPAFDPVKMLKVCERIAAGDLLIDVVKEAGMPSYLTVKRWVSSVPAAGRAFQAAIELSAEAFEEKALKMGRELTKDPGSSTKVRAYEVFMNQLRWSAMRRNASKFGETRASTVTVPITINTTLPMGDNAASGSGTAEHPNIYQLEAKVQVEEKETIADVAAREPDQPLIPSTKERLRTRVGPQKRILVPRKPDPNLRPSGAQRSKEKSDAENDRRKP